MAWLTAERGRLYARVSAALVLGIVAVKLLRHAVGNNADGVAALGQDLGCFWGASRLVLAGQVTPYLQRVPECGADGFFYPPVYLALCLPIALLPFFWALVTFTALTGTAYAAAIRQAGQSCTLVFAAIGFPAVMVNLTVGQNGMLTAGVIGCSLTLLDRRPRLSGLIMGCMVIKPHLAVALPFALVLSRRWQTLTFAALSAVAWCTLSTSLLGWDSWDAFLAATRYSRAYLELGSTNPGNLFESGFALARVNGVAILPAYGLQLLMAMAGLAAWYWGRSREVSPAVERSLLVLVSLLSTPYLFPYDLVVLAFPLLWLLLEWSERGFPPWGKLVLLVGYVLPLSPLLTFIPHHLCWFGMIGFLVYVLWVETKNARSSVPVPACR